MLRSDTTVRDDEYGTVHRPPNISGTRERFSEGQFMAVLCCSSKGGGYGDYMGFFVYIHNRLTSQARRFLGSKLNSEVAYASRDPFQEFVALRVGDFGVRNSQPRFKIYWDKPNRRIKTRVVTVYVPQNS